MPHKFQISARDIGYAAFHPLRKLYEPLEGFYVNNELRFHVWFNVTQSWVERPEDLTKGPAVKWDSKKETGFVGLQNQGATCYLNSLLQSLYHLPRFRHLVYSIAAEPNSSAASLQRLFWKLEHDAESVSTTELTKSFGWNIEDIAVQHDVQELLRKLIDKLEEKVKDSPLKGSIEKLFRGTYMDILKCRNVDYERKQEIAYCDLSLNVSGCDTLEDALRKFTEWELLDGDNQYKSDTYGFQDANKGIKLNMLPPVLHLHLKRFEYQYQNDPPTLEKVNAKQVFPPSLRMGEFLDIPTQDTDETTYDLFGILVHSGSAQTGHYYAFMRPAAGQPDWYKFDDSKVSRASESDAIDDNFGGDEITEMKIARGGDRARRDDEQIQFATEKHSSAYMLVYVRRPDIPTVFSDSRLPEEAAFVEKMEAEMEKARQDEIRINEMKQYTQVRVFTADESCLAVTPEDTLGNGSGHDSDLDAEFERLGTRAFRTSTMPSLFNARNGRLVLIKKEELMKTLKVEVEKQLGIPVARQRLWGMKEVPALKLDFAPLSVEQCNLSVAHYFRSINTMSRIHDLDDIAFDIFVEVNDEIEVEAQAHLRTDASATEGSQNDSKALEGQGNAGDGTLESNVGAQGATNQNTSDDSIADDNDANATISAGVNQRGFPGLEETRLLFVRYFDPTDASFTFIGPIHFPDDGGSVSLLADFIQPLISKSGVRNKKPAKKTPSKDAINEKVDSEKKIEDSDVHGISAATAALSVGEDSSVLSKTSGEAGADDDPFENNLIFFITDPSMSETVDGPLEDVDFRTMTLHHGSFITVQFEVKASVGKSMRYRTVKEYLQYLRNRVMIEFRPLSSVSNHTAQSMDASNVIPKDAKKQDSHTLILPFTTDSKISEIWDTLARELNWPSDQIAISALFPGTWQPRSQSTAYDPDQSVGGAFATNMYSASYSTVPLLYELLEVPLQQTRGKYCYKVVFVDANARSHPLTLYLEQPVTAQHIEDEVRSHPTVSELLDLAEPERREAKKVASRILRGETFENEGEIEKSKENQGENKEKVRANLRVYEYDPKGFSYKGRRPSESIPATANIAIEEVSPLEEMYHARKAELVFVYILQLSASGAHSMATHRPFTMIVSPTEKTKDLKERILRKIRPDAFETPAGALPTSPRANMPTIEIWRRNPIYSSKPCRDDEIWEEYDSREAFVCIRSPPPPPSAQKDAGAGSDAAKLDTEPGAGEEAPPTVAPKEKPRNSLHLGD